MNLYREPWMRWYDLPVLKRIGLARWSFSRKYRHPKTKRLARLRSLYWVLVRGHDSEICAVCGGPVRLVFHVPDAIWAKAAGFPWSNERAPGGEAAPGVLCPACFDDLFREAAHDYLRWTCTTDDETMVG